MTSFPVHEITQGALLELLARERPEREALIYPDRDLRLSFGELESRSMELARGLIALGVEPGERVTLWSDNRPDWIPFQFALAQIGAVLVTANTALTKPEILYVLKQSRSCAVIAAPGRSGTEYHEALNELVGDSAGLPELRHWIELEEQSIGRALGLSELVERGRSISPEEVSGRTANTRLDDTTNIQYTSGTTGFPKGVVLTHRNLIENAYTIARLLDTCDSDVQLLQVPLFHCFGCSVSVLGAYTHGIPLVATQGFDPLQTLRAVRAENCTIIHGVPTMFSAIMNADEFESLRPTTLRAGVMAGAMCPEPLMRRVIREMGCEGMLVAYGLTEASPGITCSRPEDAVEIRCGTVGRALPGVEVRIVKADGEDVRPDEAGELWARGPNIMRGYNDDEAATAQTLTPDGWLRTGDLATMDADSLVRITGRIKEMIIRGGENVSPAEVEDALRTHTAVVDAAVFGVPSERFGEEVAAALILRGDATLDVEEVDAHLADRLAAFKRPTRIAIVDAFPLTPSGKVQKFRLQESCRFG